MSTRQPILSPPLAATALADPYQAYPTEWTDIATLTPHPRNYRAHPADQLAHIQASIQAHGFYRNIVVAEDGTILAGHGVVQAAAQLGYTQVPVIRLPLAPDDERAMQILVGDNEMPRLSVNDEQVLAGLLTELQASDPLMLLGTGFDEDTLVALVEASGYVSQTGDGVPTPVDECEIPVDRAEELREKHGVQVGQVWACGEHRIICGDCTDKAVIEQVLGAGTIEAVITDPPYGVGWDTDYTRFSNDFATQRQRYAPLVGDERPFDPRPWLDYPKVILWGANWYCQHIPLGSWLVWDKRHSSGAAFLSDAELAWMKGKRGISLYAETVQGAIRTERSMHPTQKPVGVMAWCLEKAEVHETVLDPFLGSGSTLLAAHQLNRRCYGIEITPGYVAVALERWSVLTGEIPTLVG